MIRIDLPTAIHAIPDDVEATGQCSYIAPCVVGMMMTQSERNALDDAGKDGLSITGLVLDSKMVSTDHVVDLQSLQHAFDMADTKRLRAKVAELKARFPLPANAE